MKVVIVGGGVMGEAILSASIAAGVLAAANVTVIEKLEARRAILSETHGVATSADFAAMADADVVLLSVKPQEMKSVAGALRSDALLVSIMAGVTIASVASGFGPNRIVRVMPNTPGAV